MSEPVPRLDLAPRLKRRLQPWNPLDYVRLLYWVFFFPQALRWYEQTFADPQYRDVTGREVWMVIQRDSVRRDLALMGLFLTLFIPPAVATALQGMGVSISWFGVALSVAGGVISRMFDLADKMKSERQARLWLFLMLIMSWLYLIFASSGGLVWLSSGRWPQPVWPY